MAKINSKQKGKRGELDLVHFLKEHGIEARRGQQFQGGEDSPDVITSIGTLHLECKYTKQLRIYDAINQAKADAKPTQIPVVAYRDTRREWLAIMPLDALLKFFVAPNEQQHNTTEPVCLSNGGSHAEV